MVSKHIRELETRAGTRLLNRTTRKVSLTEAGEIFSARAEEAVLAWDGMMESATEDKQKPSGLLRVAGPKVFGETTLAPVIADFLKSQPHLRAHLVFEERQVDVVGERFDIAIRVGELRDSSLIAVKLISFPYVVCASPEYLERRGIPKEPEDLLTHDGIVNTAIAPNGQWVFERNGNVTRIAVPARFRVNSDAPAAAFVRAGLGVGLCIRHPLEADLAAGRIVPILEPFHAYDRDVFALIPHRTGMPAKTRLLIDFLKSRLRSSLP